MEARTPHIWTISAGWVFPVSSKPIRDGIVVLERSPFTSQSGVKSGTCRIVSVGRTDEVRYSEKPDVEYPQGVLIPGLVNAHAHVELASLAGKIAPGMDFPDWLRAVISLRSKMIVEDPATDQTIKQRCRELLESGCTTVGDLLSAFTPRNEQGVSLVEEACRICGLRAVLYSELIGFAPKPSHGCIERLKRELGEVSRESVVQYNGIYRGVGPHAPYSAGEWVIRESVRLARERRLPLTIHVSEWPDERNFMLRGGGPCEELLRMRDNWDQNWTPPGTTPVDYLDRLGATGSGCSFVHCNNLEDSEIRTLAGTGTVAVHCPGSHHYFRRDPFPFKDFLDAGVTLALGTDSLASNEGFNMLAEIRQAHTTFPSLQAQKLLEMATLNGAKALGLDNRIGSLEAGKEADFAVIPVPDKKSHSEECLSEALFSGISPCLVIANGRMVVDRRES